MRIAYVGPVLSGTEKRTFSTVNEDWIRSLVAAGHDVHLLLDHNSAAAARLRDEGVALSISHKRRMTRPDGTPASADQMEAGLLGYVHERTPLDLIVYSSDYPVDLSWHEPTLGDVPRAVVLGDGPVLDIASVLRQSDLTRTHGRTLWTRASLWASGDLVLSPCEPAAFGLTNETMPPWSAVGAELSATDQPPAGLVLVLATAVDARRAVGLLPQVFDMPIVTESTTVVVQFCDLATSFSSMRELIMEGCPEDREQQLVMVPDFETAALAGFLRVADVVVAESPPELVKLGMSFKHTPVVLLDGASLDRPSVDLANVPVADRPGVLTVEVEGSPRAAVPAIEALSTDPDGPDVVVMHVPAFTARAARLATYRALGRTDLAVLCATDPVFGGPDLYRPNRWVLAAHRRVWPSLIRRMALADNMDILIRSVIELGMVEHVRLLMLPDEQEGTLAFDEFAMQDAPAWTDDYPVLGRPDLSGLHGSQPAAPMAAPLLRLQVVSQLRKSRAAATVRKRYPQQMRRLRLLLEGKS